MQNIQHFYFLPKVAQHRLKGHRVIENLFIGYFGVPDRDMQFYAKYATILFFAQNGPAPFQVSHSHLQLIYWPFWCSRSKYAI